MKKETIKTSVIIPVYNTEKYLVECIESVLRQTQKEIEIILIDDGSTDGSRKIIEKYEKDYENIVAVYQENKKQGAARNVGINLAKGKYIYFLDSDDYIAEDTLERCYINAEEKKTDFLLFDAYTFREKMSIDIQKKDRDMYDRSLLGITDEVLEGSTFWYKYYKVGGVLHCPPLVYIRRNFIISNYLFFMEGVFYEDAEWIVRMYMHAETVWYYQEKFYYRRYRSGSVMTTKYEKVHVESCFNIIISLMDIYSNEEDKLHKEMVFNIINLLIGRVRQIIIEMKNEEDISYLKQDIQRFNVKIHVYLRNCLKLEQPIRVAIFGTGKMCDKIFEWYEKNKLNINANVVFIVSQKAQNQYRNYRVFNVEEVKGKAFEHIIVSSEKYKEEMMLSLEENNITSNTLFTISNVLFL